MLFTKRLACTAAAMHMPASAYARNLFTTPMRTSNVTRFADRSGLWAVDKLRRTSNIIDVMESTMDAMRREMSREIGVPLFDMSDGQWLRRADNVVETSTVPPPLGALGTSCDARLNSSPPPLS